MWGKISREPTPIYKIIHEIEIVLYCDFPLIHTREMHTGSVYNQLCKFAFSGQKRTSGSDSRSHCGG